MTRAQATRACWIAAAALTAAALLTPLWGFSMSAPQYPGETLHLRVTTQGIAGDVQEVETLQHYIGVRFPTHLPELTLAVRAMAALAALLAAAALARGSGIGRAFRVVCAAALVVFIGASAVGVQRRLYEVGHVRDPHAPIRAVHDFTPPLIGPVKVGNFTVWSYPHAGAIALLMAAGLALAGTRRSAPKRLTTAPHASPVARGKAVA
jgi:hypothetical protein